MPRICFLIALLLTGGAASCSKGPPGPTTLRIEVWDKVTGDPVPGWGVQVVEDETTTEVDRVSGNWLNLTVTPEASIYIRLFDAKAPAEEQGRILKQERIRGLDPGEFRTVRYHVNPRYRPHWARVLDEATGLPIVGAELLYLGDPIGMKTDEQGLLAITAQQDAELPRPLVFRVEGYEEATFEGSGAVHTTKDKPELMLLRPEGSNDFEYDREQREAAFLEVNQDAPVRESTAFAWVERKGGGKLGVGTWETLDARQTLPSPIHQILPVASAHDPESTRVIGTDGNGQIIFFGDVPLERFDGDKVELECEWQPTGFLTFSTDHPRSDLRVQIWMGDQLVAHRWLEFGEHFQRYSVPAGNGEARFFQGIEQIGTEAFEVADQEYKPIRFDLP